MTKKILVVLSLLILSVLGYNLLTPSNAAILFIDDQTGLFNGVQSQTAVEFKNNILALVSVAQIFNLPAVVTTSFQDGPNGPIIPEILTMLPNATLIARPGQINAFDDPDFVAAVNNTNRTKLIMAGISTDVCLTFAALSAKDLGYDVYAVMDSSGTWSKLIEETAFWRMGINQINIMGWDDVSSELQADWRNATGPGYTQLLATYLPFYGNLITQKNFTANLTNSSGP